MKLEHFKSDFNYLYRIKQIQQTLNMSDYKIAEILGVTPFQFDQVNSFQKQLSFANIETLCNYLKISIELFVNDSIDYLQLKKQHLGISSLLPSKYSYAKRSKARTVKKILDYVEAKFGIYFKNNLLISLQVDPFFFSDLNNEMNINLIEDICCLLKTKYFFTSKDFFEMGLWSYNINKHNELGVFMSSFDSTVELIDTITSEFSYKFDKNFDYKVMSYKNGELSIRSTPSKEAQSELNTKLFGNSSVCLTKQGVFSSFSMYSVGNPAFVSKNKCMYQGDSYTEYKLSVNTH